MENYLTLLPGSAYLSLAAALAILGVGILYIRHYKRAYVIGPRKFKMSTPKELRRTDRIKLDSVVQLTDDSGQFDAAAKLHNISLEGLCISSPLQLSRDERIHASLPAYDKGEMSIASKIAWTKSEAGSMLYGLKILKIRTRRA